MSKKMKHRLAWIAIALSGILLSGWLYNLRYELPSLTKAFTLEFLSNSCAFLRHLPEACFPLIIKEWELVPPGIHEWITRVNFSSVYALFALGMLLFSIYRWYTGPRSKTLLVMLFCGWILCGYPGQFFMILPHMLKEFPSPPGSNEYVHMPGGEVIRLLSEKDRHDPRFASGYEQVLPDGRSFYVVPRK